MTLKQMYEQRQQLVAQARERLDEINANTDEGRAAELESQHDAAMAEVDALDSRIEREERMNAATTRFENRMEQRRQEGRPNIDGNGGDVITEEREITYRDAFHMMLRHGGDVHDMESDYRNVLRQGVATDELRQQLTTTPAAGGYTVPTELQNILIEAMAAWGPMYNEDVATVLTTAAGNPLDMPTIDDTAVTAEGPRTEGSDLTDDGGKDATFGQKTLNAYVYDTEFVKWSLELGQDSIFNVEQLLGRLLGMRLGRKANEALTVGTGTNQPNGIVTASSLGITAVGTNAITSDEIINLIHSLDPAYRGAPKVGFMFNDQTLAAVRKLKDGDGNYLWEAGNFQNGIPGTIQGYGYRVNQAMAGIATGNRSMIFGDMGAYFVRKVGNIILGVMRERFWPNMGIAGLVRIDGELGDTRAIKHLVQA